MALLNSGARDANSNSIVLYFFLHSKSQLCLLLILKTVNLHLNYENILKFYFSKKFLEFKFFVYYFGILCSDVSGRFKMGENEEEEVTPEQTDLIVQFSAATGTEDLDQCAANLRVSFGVGVKKRQRDFSG